MDFSFTEEQTLLAESVSRFMRNDYPFAERRDNVQSELGFSAAHWKTFSDLGWLALPFAEEHGGFGAGAVEMTILLEEFGKGLVIEPYVATVVLAGGALKHGGTPAQQAAYISRITDGSKQGALAFAEAQSRFNLADVTTTASRDGDGFVLNGSKSVVLNAPNADFIIVSARTSGTQLDEVGVSLFLVDVGTAGLSMRSYPTVDAFRAAEVEFTEVRVGADALVGNEGQGFAILEQVIDDGIVAVGAEAVGCMEVLYKDTVEYCKTREQFGQPIGKFQVLQHRMVDMFIEYEQAKSLLYMAAMRLDEGYGQAAQKAASAFKVQVGKSGRFVGQNAVQLHGGMGMTDELNVGHYFKRLTVIDTLFGNVDHHLKRFGGL